MDFFFKNMDIFRTHGMYDFQETPPCTVNSPSAVSNQQNDPGFHAEKYNTEEDN